MPNEVIFMSVDAWKRQYMDSNELPDDVGLVKDVDFCVREVNQDRREVTIAYSAESVDRDGDIIRQKGIDLKAYRKNPVVLFAHGSRFGPAEGQLPIARSMKLFRSEDNLKSFSIDRFTEADMNPLGDTVFRMLASSPAFLNAASIGFLPKKVEQRELDEDEQGLYWSAADFKKTEKLEHSIVPVPANADALRGAKSAGIDLVPIKKWAEGVLDAGENEPQMSRDHLEACYRLANNARATIQIPKIQGQEAEVVERGEVLNEDDKGTTPGNPSGFKKADEDTAWSAPTLSAFGVTGAFDDLSATRRSQIARHYAWAEKMPPDAFGQLKLPHHRANDAAVVLRGANAALAALNGARGGVNIPSDDKQPANTHLNAHRKQYGLEPIALKDMDEAEYARMLRMFAKEIAERGTSQETEARREDQLLDEIDREVGEIIASFAGADSTKEEDVAEETTEKVETAEVKEPEKAKGPPVLGTIEVKLNTKETKPGTEDVESKEAEEVFDVSAKETDDEDFDFPSIKDEKEAEADTTEVQLAEMRQAVRAMAELVKKLVGAIKVAGTPDTEKEPETKEEEPEADETKDGKGTEPVLFFVEDEPEPEKEEQSEEAKVGQLITETTAKAVVSAINEHAGRLPN
ncbi:MAG: hypothetical protein GY769_07650 [bacterium]|nr:hypothetical protein [bacterium]